MPGTIHLLQAHVPTHALSWLVGVANPIVYVLLSNNYRQTEPGRAGLVDRFIRSMSTTSNCISVA